MLFYIYFLVFSDFIHMSPYLLDLGISYFLLGALLLKLMGMLLFFIISLLSFLLQLVVDFLISKFNYYLALTLTFGPSMFAISFTVLILVVLIISAYNQVPLIEYNVFGTGYEHLMLNPSISGSGVTSITSTDGSKTFTPVLLGNVWITEPGVYDNPYSTPDSIWDNWGPWILVFGVGLVALDVTLGFLHSYL